MEELEKKLFGHSTENISVVFITPLESTFNKILIYYNQEKIFTECFFKNAVITNSENIKIMLVCVPQGRSSQDVFFGLQNKHVIFYGYAGAVNKNIKVGSIVEIEKVIEDNELNCLKVISNYKKVTGGYSPCMLGPEAIKYQKKARETECDIVEMEICACAKAASVTSNSFSAFVVISDIPEVEDFWNISQESAECFKKSKKELLSFIEELLNKWK